MSLITQQPQLSPVPPDPDLLARLVAPGAFAPLRAPGILPPTRQPDAAPITPTAPLGPIGEVPGKIGAAPGPMAPPADLTPQPAAPHGLRGLLDRLNPIGASSPIAGLLKPQPKLPSDQPLPPAQDAQQQIIGARQQEQAIRPPQYTGKLGALEKVGDVAARLFAPGIESNLGIGTIGYQDRLKQAQGATDRAEKQAATEASTAANAAKPEEAQAKIDQANDKLAQAYRKQGLDPEGNPLPDDQLTQQELATRHLTENHAALMTAQTEAQQSHAALLDAQQQALANPNSPEFKVKLQQAQTAADNAKAKLQAITYAQIRGIISASEINPAIMELPGLGLSQQEISSLEAGLPKNPETGAPVGMHSVIAPTTATRTRGQQAAEVIPNFDEAAQQIAQLGPQLGPMAGRWNDLLTGKGGFSNPAFAGLRANLDLINGAYSKFHLNTEMGYKTFSDLLNASQSPENLKASLAQMKALAQRYVESGEGNPNAGGKSPNAGGQTITQQELNAVAKAQYGGDVAKAKSAAKAEGYTVQ